MAKAVQTLTENSAAIKSWQEQCPHERKHFVGQVNAYHQYHWAVRYRCAECELETVETKEPVCEICNVTLLRATEDDLLATEEKSKLPWSNAVAYRCPNCSKLHILVIHGD